MAQTVCVIASPSDRARLEAIVADRNRPRKHAERARVVLASIAGDPVQRVAAQLGVSRQMIWRGNNVLLKRAWTVCCVIRRASPGSRQSPLRRWRAWWP
jgi:hypothetical protein